MTGKPGLGAAAGGAAGFAASAAAREIALSGRRRAAAPWAAVWVVAVSAVSVVSGCAHYPRTQPLGATPPPARYAFEPLVAPNDDDEIFVCVAMSGGGTRAAAFAYGVLDKLRRTELIRPRSGRRVNLLDEVDCLSSVSGGSFTAAYFALHGRGIFQDFRARFLDRDVQGELMWAAINPLAWPRLMSPTFSRIDLAVEIYDRDVFDGRTYGDLMGRGRRPYLIVNGTELDSGERFVFTQDEFDLLGADLAAFPLARAVAASSAFPIALSPLTVTNNPQPAWWKQPAALSNAVKDYDVNRRTWRWARNRLAHLDKAANPFVHVMDGGLADNLGLRAILAEMWSPTGFILRRINTGRVAKLLVLTVNAKAGDRGALNRDAESPGLPDVAFKTATVAMDELTGDTIEVVADFKREMMRAQQSIDDCQLVLDDQCPRAPRLPRLPASVDMEVVDISLDTIPDAARRAKLLAIPTAFSLTKDQVDALIAAAEELLSSNKAFQRFVAPPRAEIPPANGADKQPGKPPGTQPSEDE
ncbi:MAG: patatin-like phospholipase family protein [Pseudomonadota bacterium]